jgi:hypothetical protein
MHLGADQADRDLAAALEPIAQLAVEVFGPCSAAAIDVVDGLDLSDRPGRFATLTVAPDERLVALHGTVLELDEGPAAAALRDGVVVVDELPSRLGARWDLLADDAGFASALSHPLVDDQGLDPPTVVGVLTLYGRERPGVRRLDRLAVALLASVAANLVVHELEPDAKRGRVPLDQLVLDLGLGAIPTLDLRVATDQRATAP